jgi:hypothetical protein
VSGERRVLDKEELLMKEGLLMKEESCLVATGLICCLQIALLSADGFVVPRSKSFAFRRS